MLAKKEVGDERHEKHRRIFQQQRDSDGEQVNRFRVCRLQQRDTNHAHGDEGHDLFAGDSKGVGVTNEQDGAHQNRGPDDAKEGDLEPIDSRAVHQQLDDHTIHAKNESSDRCSDVTEECAWFGYDHGPTSWWIACGSMVASSSSVRGSA